MSRPNRLLTFNFLLAAIEGLGVAWLFAAKPAGDQGASVQRILLVAAALVGTAYFGFLTVRSWRKPAWAETFFTSLAQERKKKPLVALLCLVFVVGWMGTFVPSDRLNGVIAIYERIRPAVLWLTLISGQTLLTLLIRGEWKNERPLLRMTGMALAAFLLIWVFMALTRVGITLDDRFWNEAGVPLLWLQLFLAWIASVGIGLLLSPRGAPSKPASGSSGWIKDLLTCVLLFASAAVLWSQIPVARSYFAPGPLPPNNVFYPYSDSQIYDTGAQYVFIGQGLNNNELSDKPFYVLFLVLLHLLAGQDYSQVVRLQAVFLAIFPVLVYFIGKLIHSRTAGIMAGILAVLWETNSIASTLQIQVSHARLELTEFPAACGLALTAIILILWLKNPRPTSLKLALAGGILGVVALTRPNSLLVTLLAFILIAGVFGRLRWRSSLPAVGLFALGLVLVVGPWYLVNKTPSGNSFLEEKVRAVIEQRYQGDIVPTPRPGATPTPQPSPTPQPQSTPAATAVQLTPQPGTGAAAATSMNSPFQFVPAHFFHNLDMSILILPLTFGSSDLEAALRAPYWNVLNILNLTPAQDAFLFFNLLALAIGIGAAWKTARLGGLFPLLVFLAYNLANALARNSGGRYLVPVNWIVFVYYALGLVQLGQWAVVLLGARLETTAPVAMAAATAEPARPAHWLRNGAILAAGLLLVGSSLLLVGSFFPRRYAIQSQQQLLQTALERGSLQAAGVTPQQAEDIVTQYGGIIVRGRELYPDYMNYDPAATKPDLTFSFRVIGPISAPVILPLNSLLTSFPDAADVTVLGCLDGIYVWAQAVIVENPSGSGPDAVYLRSPAPTWKCP